MKRSKLRMFRIIVPQKLRLGRFHRLRDIQHESGLRRKKAAELLTELSGFLSQAMLVKDFSPWTGCFFIPFVLRFSKAERLFNES